MTIPKISHRPTIVVEEHIRIDTNTRRDGESEKPGLDIKPPLPNWLRRLWDLLSLVYTSWELLCSIPLDLYFGALFTSTPPDCQESSTVSQVLDHNYKSTMGQLALHPILSLLAVSVLNSSEIRFYNSETAEFVWKSPVKLHKTASNDDATANSTVTCLKFSTGEKLAVGLNNGVVYILDQDLSILMGLTSRPQREEMTSNYQVISLLPLGSSSSNARFLGRVTNLAFSPTGDMMPNKENYLAIGTQKSGIWIWNKYTKQAIRAINTAGMNDGCMHWISLSEGPKELQKPETLIVEEKQLGGSTIQKFASIFGGPETLTKLDEYFAPSTGTILSSVQPSPRASYHSNGISSATGTVQGPSQVESTKSHHGESLLIYGTNKGNIRVQKLWHSHSMMRLETFTEFSPSAFAQPQRRLKSISGPASGEVTHLANLPHALTSSEVTIPILAAFSSDGSSIMHRFTVSVPLNLPDYTQTWQIQTIETGRTILVNLVNLLLLGTRHRWLPQKFTFSNPSPIIHNTAKAIPFPPPPTDKPSTSSPRVASLISTSALHLTNIVLATLDCKKARRRKSRRSYPNYPNPSQCVILRPNIHDPCSALTPIATIIPPIPVPVHLTQRTPPSQGYYTRKLAQAGMTPPRLITEEEPRAEWRAVEFCEHEFACGQVAWAKGTRGTSIGAFLYQPASSTEPGLGVCLFEVADQ